MFAFSWKTYMGSKPRRIYLAWTDRVLKEFFFQGDSEKAAQVPVSMFMDKDTTNIAKMQIGSERV